MVYSCSCQTTCCTANSSTGGYIIVDIDEPPDPDVHATSPILRLLGLHITNLRHLRSSKLREGSTYVDLHEKLQYVFERRIDQSAA